MQYSPTLKKAMEEIKAIVKRHDIGAVVVLHNAESTNYMPDGDVHTEGYCEYLLGISPSYSAASILPDGRIRVKGKAEHYGNDKSKRDKAVSNTYNMIQTLAEQTGRMAMDLIEIEKILSRHIEQTGRDRGEDTSHEQQNN